MTAPRFAPCRCGHPKIEHETAGFAPQCTASRCECIAYRPNVPMATKPATPIVAAASVVVPAAAAVVSEAPLDQVIAAGRRSGNKRIAALAERVATLGTELRERVTADAADAELRRKAAELEAQLADIRSQMRSGTPPVATRTGGEPCPDCGRPFSNLGVHRARAHGFKKAV